MSFKNFKLISYVYGVLTPCVTADVYMHENCHENCYNRGNAHHIFIHNYSRSYALENQVCIKRCGMAENKLFVSCNICGDAVEGIAYATRCHHFLCLKCAKKTFNTSKSCPVCNFTLSKADLIELSVGILPSSNITESVYHCVYSSKEWSQTLENLSSAMNSVKHATDFAAHQVLMEMKKSSQLAASLTNDIEQYRHELVF